MLKVRTYIGKDSRGGKGLFAAQDIPKGSVVWSYDPAYTKFVSVDEYFQSAGEEREALERYTYPINIKDEEMVGLLINLDHSRYTNHSEDPNTGHPQDDLNINIALRDIKEGEEITCSYHEFDPEGVIHAKGVITGKSFLLEMPKEKRTA